MIGRRRIFSGTAATIAAAYPMPLMGAPRTDLSKIWPNGFPSRRWVNVVFEPTGERFKDVYVEDNIYSRPQVEKFSHICRDVRANEWKLMDPRLLDLLYVLHWYYAKDEIRVVSGYRSPDNHDVTERPVLNKQHNAARALDLRVPGIWGPFIGLSMKTVQRILRHIQYNLRELEIFIDCPFWLTVRFR